MIKEEVFKGKFVKQCPCSVNTVACGYYNINLHRGCPFECTYCILQYYLKDKKPLFYTNIKDAWQELEELNREKKYLRIGTGELADSLAYDREKPLSLELMDTFYSFPDIVFEFKTKSNAIKNLKKSKVLKNIVVSWSLNPQEIILREEKGTATLQERLKSISSLQEKGFKIGIHLDPLLIYPNYKDIYSRFIEQLSEVIQVKNLAWLSLGALRFPEGLKEEIFKHKDSMLFCGELICGYDKKYRYFKYQKVELFKYVRNLINTKISKNLPLYLCMEDEDTWQEIFPEFKAEEEEINKRLYENVLG